MIARLCIILAASPLLGGWGDRDGRWPHVGPMPDDPATAVASRHQSITAGTKTYRPVAPLPWGDINRKVAPPGALEPQGESEPKLKNGAAPPKQPAPQHKR